MFRIILLAALFFRTSLCAATMEVYETLPQELKEVDVIVAGGGAAGCVIAARLADADPKLSILVVERGSNSFDVPTVVHPALFLSALMPTSKETLFYVGEKETQLGNRALVVPSGGTIGGGTSINLMMYSRAQRSDYDSWKTPGWSTNEMLPYMKKLETYQGPGPKDKHGFTGPINISRGTFTAKRPEQDFIQAAARVGYPEILDLTSLDANNGVMRAQHYIGTDGKRQDTATRYLRPRLSNRNKYPNLYVVVNSHVKRVLFTSNKQASGVEFISNNGTGNPDASPRTIKARNLVVLSAGALGTASILERSGVGKADVLKKVGVPVVTNLPGVGESYQDHHLMSYPYLSNLTQRETIDSIVNGQFDVGQLIQTNDPILGWNSMDVQAKVRPTESEVSKLGPEFQSAWNKEYKNVANRPLAIFNMVNAFPGDPSLVPVGQYFAVTAFTTYPYSRGSIHITGPEISNAASFKTGFFTDAKGLDIKKHIWAYKKQREIVRRMDTYRGELVGFHPPFPADSNAALVKLDGPPPKNVKDIVYTAEDDKVIEDWVRSHVETTWHSMGTSKMAPLQDGGVVDSALSVYGVKGLKVADLSIPPLNVAANTANTAIAIGEKAADIFIRELGLRGY